MAEQATSDAHEYLEIRRVEETGKEFREYVAVLRRHLGVILTVIVVLSAITAVVALALPAVYRSSATILVQEQEVPPELVRSTVTSYADERIQVISQQVMTRAVLLHLVEKYDLYEKYRDRARTDEIVEFMRKDIKIATVDANISDRSSGRRVNATIAFNISYDSPHPDRAQKVVNELVSLYLNENVKARQQSAAETTAFLTQEADRLGAQIQEIETKLAAFKRRNMGRMPDSSAVNLQLSERTDSELLRIDREISMLQDRRFALEAQLMLVNPNLPPTIIASTERVVPSDERLRTLQAQYATASALYGADHPDIRRLQREIATLKGETGASSKEGDLPDTLKQLEGELAKLKERYSDDHPDIQRLRRSIAALRASGGKENVAAKASDKRAADPVRKYDNPVYVALTNQIESTKREVAQLTNLKDDMRAKQRTYDSRLLQIPEVEREYRDLTRDYDNAQTRYREVRAKQMQAEISQELEKNRKAERFSLGEPANLPEKPHHPNRFQIMLGGLAASLAGGLGLAFLLEAFDPSVKGPLELARIATVPILTAIPYIETRAELEARKRHVWLLTGLVSLFGVAFLLGVHIYLKPLSEVLESVMRRIPFL